MIIAHMRGTQCLRIIVKLNFIVQTRVFTEKYTTRKIHTKPRYIGDYGGLFPLSKIWMISLKNILFCLLNCRFSYEVTKIQATKLLILLRFYFHDA